MAPLIVGVTSLNINYTAGGPVGTIALHCYTIALEITPSTEEIDVGTFCEPGGSDQGRTTWSAVLSLLWEPALYDLLLPHVGQQGKLVAFFNNPATEPHIEFQTRFGALPWGRFEIGQRVEVDLPLAVLSVPVQTSVL